jgi:aldose 1-epimerase
MTTLSGIDPAAFKATVQGKCCDLYVLKNAKGSEVCISNWGATVLSFVTLDKSGKPVDIVLGYKNLDAYLVNPPFVGSSVGRYSNRIGNAKFTLDGKEYVQEANNGINNLHSGASGFHAWVWDVVEVKPNSLLMSHLSPDGANGFPGNLQTQVKWILNDDNELIMDTVATTDAPTVCSITNHAYFNLNGGNCSALDAVLEMNADYFLPIDNGLVPTGEIRHVAGTKFDFRTPTPIAQRMFDDDEQLKFGLGGYDICYALNKKHTGELTTICRAYSEKTGIVLVAKTTLPAVQFYCGQTLPDSEGKVPGTKNSKCYGFCLEAEHLVDAPNKPWFQSCVLRPGEVYHHQLIFQALTQ